MEKRYSQLFMQEGLLYAKGSPVIVSAGAILSDSYTGKILVQLKYKNISPKSIFSLTVQIQPLDAAGESKWELVEYRYNDLDVRRNDSFGTNTAIVLPSSSVRGYRLKISRVSFGDGSRWQGGDAFFTVLPTPKKLEAGLGDDELTQQFRIRYGNDCIYQPCEQEDLWFCTCGAINHSDENKCHRCKRVFSAMKSINLSSLRSETTKRIATEKKFEEEDNIEQNEKRGKLIKTLAILVPLVLIITVLLATLPKYLSTKNNYLTAQTLLSDGKYDQAQEAFAALGDYEDSRELAEKEIPYQKAMYVMDCADRGDINGLLLMDMKRSELEENETVSTALYEKAIEMFTALGDYKDSAQQTERAQKAISDYYDSILLDSYDQAMALFEQNSFCQARDAFEALGDYKDSAQMLSECLYRKAELLSDLTDKYSMEGIYCTLGTKTGEKSVFYIPKSVFLKLGSGIASDIRDICEKDGVEINYEDVPAEGGYLPYCDAVSELFNSLGGYKDSTDKAASATEAGDYTKPFYEYIRSGNLAGAAAWLNEFTGEFEKRDQWMSLINLYMPYAGTWAFDTGDPTLIPLTLGISFQCNNIQTVIYLSDDGGAKMRLYPEGNTDYPIELIPSIKDDGSIKFEASPDGMNTYSLLINNQGQLTYSKYNNYSDSKTINSAVYNRIG